MKFLRHLQNRRNQLAETRDILRNFAKPWRLSAARLRLVRRSKISQGKKHVLLAGPEHIDLPMTWSGPALFRCRGGLAWRR
jgi:hypothetical protein